MVKNNKSFCLPSSDSFVMHIRNKAMVISWILTFAFISFVSIGTKRDSSPLPTEFYLNLTSFFMLAVFGVSFFILFRTGDADGLGQGETE